MSDFKKFINDFNNSDDFRNKIETKIKAIYLSKNIKRSKLSTNKIIKEFIVPIVSDEGFEVSEKDIKNLESIYGRQELNLEDLSNVAGGVNPILTIGMSIMSLLPSTIQENAITNNPTSIVMEQKKEGTIESVIAPAITNPAPLEKVIENDNAEENNSTGATSSNQEATSEESKATVEEVETKQVEEIKVNQTEEQTAPEKEAPATTQPATATVSESPSAPLPEPIKTQPAITQSTQRLKIPKKGIDVSVYQGNIDWKKVKASGIEFAIIRIGFGSSDVDKCFKKNIEGAKAAGLKVGVYLYSYAQNTAQAQAEARFVLEQLKGYKLDYPVCYDVEDRKWQGHLSSEELTQIAKTFLQTVKSAGYKVSLYSFVSWLNTKFDMNQLKEFDVWAAQWSNKCTYKRDYGMWQYSETGVVPGIKGSVDLDYSYMDY